MDDSANPAAEKPQPETAAQKVRCFPQSPGVYLMKDAAGRVIYVGKAKNLRARAGSYFLKGAAGDPRTADLVREIADIDYLEAESEVDALLMEARLIKDIQPKYNRELRDDKTGARACMVRLPARRACAGRCRSCSGYSSFAPVRFRSTRRTNAGAGFGRVCWPRSSNARPPAICVSAKTSIAA